MVLNITANLEIESMNIHPHIHPHNRGIEIMKTETTNTLCPICGGKMDVKHVMNTGDSDTNKTTIFLEYMNEIYVDRDFYSRGKIIEMAKDKYVELHGNVENKLTEKQ